MTDKGKAPLRTEHDEEDYSHCLRILLQTDHYRSYPDSFPQLLMKSKRRAIEQMGEISCSKIGDEDHELYVNRLLLHTYAAHVAELVVSAVCVRRMEFEKKWPKSHWQWAMRSWFEKNWILYHPDEHVHAVCRYTSFLEELKDRQVRLSTTFDPTWQVSSPQVEGMDQSTTSDEDGADQQRATHPSQQIKLVKVCTADVFDEFKDSARLEMIRSLEFGTFTVKRTSDITWQEWKMMERFGLLEYYFRVNMYLIPYDAIAYFLYRAFVSSENALLYHGPEGNVVEITWEMVANAYGQLYGKSDSIFVEGCSTHDIVERSPRRLFELINVTNQRDGGEARDCVPELIFDRKEYDGSSASFVANMVAEVIFCNTRSNRFTYPMVYQILLALDGFQVNWAHAILHGIRTEVAYLQRLVRRWSYNRSSAAADRYNREEGTGDHDSRWSSRIDWGPTLAPILYHHRRILFPVSQWETIERNWKQIKENKGPSYSSLHDMRAVLDVLFSEGYNYDDEVEKLRSNVDSSTSLIGNSRTLMEDFFDRETRVSSSETSLSSTGHMGKREDDREEERQLEETTFVSSRRRLHMTAGHLASKVRNGSSESTAATEENGGLSLESTPESYSPFFPGDESLYDPSRDSRSPQELVFGSKSVGILRDVGGMDEIDPCNLQYSSPQGSHDADDEREEEEEEEDKTQEGEPDPELSAVIEEMHVDNESPVTNGTFQNRKTLQTRVVTPVNWDESGSVALDSCLHDEFIRRYEEFCSNTLAYLFDPKGKRKLTEEELEQYHDGSFQLGWADKVRGKLELFKAQADRFYEGFWLEFPVESGASDNSKQSSKDGPMSNRQFALDLFRSATKNTIYAFESIIFLLEREEGKRRRDIT